MSDPLRTDPTRREDVPAEADKEARIEQLLLSGLDLYFAGQYEQAINIWTRVVFLERGHDRARAYIERARSALAERHRECEELLHRGVAAFDRGETEAARDLLTQAVEQGGPHDLALVFLERLNRLGATPADAHKPPGVDHRPAAPLAEAPPPPRVRWGRWIGMTAAAVMAGALLVLGAMPSWLTEGPATPPGEQVPLAPPEPLPVIRSSEITIARARSLFAGGHVRDALRALDAVSLADPMRPEADRLRTAAQQKLLEAARTERRTTPAAGMRP